MSTPNAADDTPFLAEESEGAAILAGLRALIKRTQTPIIRTCLEDAHDDIAHLVGIDVPPLAARDDEAA